MNDARPAPTAVRQAEPSSLRLAGTLFVAGAVSGLAIAGAFRLTKPIIDANEAQALRRAIYQVVPGSSKMQAMVVRDGKLAPLPGNAPANEPVLYGAYDDAGKFLGYAIENSGSGFQDTINLLYGFDPARRMVTGLEILASLETPGLGDKIAKDPEFAANFSDLVVDPEVLLVKTGRGAPNEVDAITGATISSKAVVKIVNGGNQQWLARMPAAGQEPAWQAAPDAPDAGKLAAKSGKASED
ncbi:MAG: FMN-binding protein [Candidatus Binatia bacterium]